MRKSHEFRATAAMKIFAQKRAKLGDEASITEIAREIGVSRETCSRWQAIAGFNEWLSEQLTILRTPILDALEAIAISKLDEFKYWEALAIKYGYIKSKSDDADKAQPAQPLTADDLNNVVQMVMNVRAQKTEAK